MSHHRALATATVLVALAAAGCGWQSGKPDNAGFRPGVDSGGVYFERGAPSGVYAGKQPRGAVLVIHGGAWHIVGRRAVRSMRPDSARLNALGFSTLSIDYHRGRAGFADVLRFYDRLRRGVGERTPICAFGVSAGGHLALMLAERRADLACVVAEAPPTLLDRLTGDVRRYAHTYFGDEAQLRAWSPALGVKSLHAPTLVAQAANDHLVPLEQSAALVSADPRVRRIVLRPGPAAWIHARVDSGDLERLDAAENAFIEQSARSASQELARAHAGRGRVAQGRARVSDTRSPHRLRDTGGPHAVRGT